MTSNVFLYLILTYTGTEDRETQSKPCVITVDPSNMEINTRIKDGMCLYAQMCKLHIYVHVSMSVHTESVCLSTRFCMYLKY